MFSMLWKSINFRVICFFLFWIASTVAASESNFPYFQKGIDYWNENSMVVPQEQSKIDTKPAETPAPKMKEEKEENSFSWEKYMDPKNKEFFKEGDYIPPEPFMELVRDPSDENMKNWFSYIEKKNELSMRLEQKMVEYLAKNGQIIPKDKVAALRPVINKSIDPKRYRLRMYFNSTCPHCKRMFATLAELQEQGFFVEARQIDREHGVVRSLPFPVEVAPPDEVKQKKIQSVPLLLIGDLKKKVVYRLTGDQPTIEVLKAIQSQSDVM